MQRKIVCFINPISGTHSKTHLSDRISAFFSAHQISCTFFPTVYDGQYEFALDYIVEHQCTDILICGGDGTANQIIQAFQHLPVQFGIVPMGSGNGLAFAAGIPVQLEGALQIVLQGKSVAADAFRVNEEFACMLCGLGFDAWVAHAFAKKEKRGLWTYAQTSLQHFMEAKPYRFEISHQDQRWETEAFFISIANSNQFGNHLTIAPQASLSDGLLDMVVFGNMNKAFVPFALLQQISLGKPSTVFPAKPSSVQYFQSAAVSIRNLDQAPLHIDGEPRESVELLEIKVMPGAFQLLVP
jgi:YegS/Rv2252/BmrU family lipid kinase